MEEPWQEAGSTLPAGIELGDVSRPGDRVLCVVFCVMECLVNRLSFIVVWILFSHLDALPVRGEDATLSGRLLDASGQPVAHADLSCFWRANGSPRRADGTEYDLTRREEASLFWGNIGKMHVFQPGTSTDEAGRFQLNLGPRRRHFLAIDQERNNGAIYRWNEHSEPSDIEIQLVPLTTVRAKVRIADSDSKPVWSHVYVELEHDPKQPLASTRVVSCGSENQAFEFRLPEGSYTLDVYAVSGEEPENIDLRVVPAPQLSIGRDGGTVDLGTLELQVDQPDRMDLETASKQAKRWHDVTKHYGEPSPTWHAIDARGLDVRATIGDLKGKWVLLEFWGLSCAPCLSEHLPDKIEFYHQHMEDRDRFEVVGVCIDITGRINSMEQLDTELQPIIENVWDGRRLPFPIVLDNTFQSWERFGIPGLGTAVLVDPDGNVVEGGVEKLRSVLKDE